MKKLIVAAMAIALAGVASAASYEWTWQAKSGRLFDGTGSDTANRYAGTGYLFDSASYSQATLLAAFYDTATTVDGSYLASKAIADTAGSFSSGRQSGTPFEMETHTEFGAYFAVLSSDGKGLYISDAPTFDISDVGSSYVTFGNQNDYSSAFKTANASYSGAGWYTASVPEPTSGLLLLLGMAGLALKRKRA